MRRTDPMPWLEDLTDAHDPAAVAEVLEALASYTAPEPSAASTAALLERLRPLVPRPAFSRRFRTDGGLTASPLIVAYGVLRAQFALFRPLWWLVTAAAAFAGPFAARAIGVPVALLVPPLALAGIAHAFRETGSPAAEIELCCAVRPVHLALARMLIVLTWVAGLGALPAAFLHLGSFATWGAGLLLFGGAALVLTLWAGHRGALGLGLAAWVGLMAQRLLAVHPRPIWLLEDGPAAALGATLCLVALLLAGRLFRLPREEA